MLWHSLGWLDLQAQSQGISKSAAVAVGHDQLAGGTSAISLAILT